MTDDKENEGFKWRWLSRVASADGPPSSTTRHVMLTLALHMDPDGSNCYPGTRRLKMETGLSRKCVMDHLGIAEGQGWIERRERQRGGQGWKRHVYAPTLPKVVNVGDHLDREGGEGGLPRLDEGGEPHVQKVVKEGDLSSSIKIPVTDMAKLLWEIWSEEFDGNGGQRKLTPKRRKLLKALHHEQLRHAQDPAESFRWICKALKASDHHMSKSAYQLPESFLKNPERRETWTRDGEDLRKNGSAQPRGLLRAKSW